ncbi:hypothetical protein K2173_016221 [Erythroxylum novogranatense]|uniref:DNA ligase n=1 Tax=Erythroxylum novogranatense TaxID=1862640 RepID=A0AAV8SG85_9ROSI|nr:hypothetical protein K2173_016221 [Erythroxylum novogranatense]
MSGQTKFSVLVSMFEWIQKTKYSAQKRAKFRKFLDNFCSPDDYFAAIRLILPGLDRERGSYGLKESVLAAALVDALGMSKDSADALRLFNWRKGGAKTGANVGNFPLVASEVLQSRQGMSSGGLTIREVNDLLDRLASSENRTEKSSILSTMIKKTNTQEMKWIIMIILKDLKLGISEKSIFHEFHPDAEELFNVTCDLKLVCERLRDRSQRHKRQDIEVGKAVRPQLAMRVSDAHAAWKKQHGKEIVVECKFDGDRIQIHKNGTEVHYFSRNFIDHSEYAYGMSEIIVNNVLADRCILDGEMLVWDTSLNRFAEFGSNQEIAKAAKDGLDCHKQLCYVAFDILYVGDTSVIHQILKERHELLQKVVKPLKGRLEILIPNRGLNTHRAPGQTCWSLRAYSLDDVEIFFKETIENRDEGIVLKDLGSKWEPSDRSGKWLKLKPEYIRAGSDLDVLIIGGYYGSGRRGGQVAQFLVGLAERPAPNTYPRRFISFCRVGTGLTDDELDAVANKLNPYFRKYEYPKKGPPSFYQVTNNSKERPDVWLESPEKSIILSITSDIRTINSDVFAAPYSLRFPRIDRVRYDKPWHECLDVQSFIELVHTSNGTTQKGKEVQDSKPTRFRASKRGDKKNISVVPSHLIQTDVSDIKGETLIFSNMMFYFVNVPPSYSLEALHKMVAEHGGTFSMNLNTAVTHCIASESKGIKYGAAKLRGDVIHCSWVIDCCSQKKLLPLQPKYFLFLSDASKKKLQEEIDEFSDSYYWDLDLEAIKQLLNNINVSGDAKTTEHVKKYCPKEQWCRFCGCSIYFFISGQYLTPDWESLLGLKLRRLKLEVCIGGGDVTNNLARATHLVVLTVPGSHVDFDSLVKSFTAVEKQVLLDKRLHLVGSRWLEDSFGGDQKLQEDTYILEPSGFEWANIKDCISNIELEAGPSHMDGAGKEIIAPLADRERNKREGKSSLGNSRMLESPKRDVKRKRGRPPGRSTGMGKIDVNQARRTRAFIVKKPAKISSDKSDDNSSDDGTNERAVETGEENHESHRTDGLENSEIERRGMVEDSKSGETIDNTGDVDKRQELQQELFNEVFDMENDNREHHGLESERNDKLEVMFDPVNAMLMDMIPSLRMKEAETTIANPVDEKVTTNLDSQPVKKMKEAETANANPDDEKPTMNLDSQPVKKKKVSYRDVASKLLKDW